MASEEVERARLLAFRGESAHALALLDAVLQQEPGDVEALLLKGTVLLEDREGAAARECFERAVAAAPRSAEALNGLARCLHALGDDEKALELAREAKALLGEPGNARHRSAVLLTIVWCLREMRLYREALEVAEEGLSGMPDAILAHWASLIEEEYAEAQKEEC